MAHVVRNGGYNYSTFYFHFLLSTKPAGQEIKDFRSNSKNNNEFLSLYPTPYNSYTIEIHCIVYKKEISELVCKKLGFRLSSN